MKDITPLVGEKPGYEVFWGVAQNSVIIFKNFNVIEVISLKQNSEEEAVKKGREFLRLR